MSDSRTPLVVAGLVAVLIFMSQNDQKRKQKQRQKRKENTTSFLP